MFSGPDNPFGGFRYDQGPSDFGFIISVLIIAAILLAFVWMP